MSVWSIKVLNYGHITVPKGASTPNLDMDLTVDWPYLGFLLQNGERNILVDTGISENFIIDGKAWGAYAAVGGSTHVEKALRNAGVDPLEIETILYTHLHNDHAANAGLFKNARLIFQKKEWQTLLDPLPVMKVRQDYDLALIDELKTMNCVAVDGDFMFTEGIYCFMTPGHTLGSMSIAVQTNEGIRIIVGDHWHIHCMAFGWMDEIADMHGVRHKITPAPKVLGRFIPSTLIYDYYDYYDSSYKILAMLPEDKPQYVLPGHEPSLLAPGV